MSSSNGPDTPTRAATSTQVATGLQRVLLLTAAMGWLLSPLSSTWSGLAWLALALAALIGLVSSEATRPPTDVDRAMRHWWWATTAASALAMLALLPHGDPWSSLQDNIRLWLGAGTIVCLAHRWPRRALTADGWMGVCAAACAVSAVVALSHTRDHLPGNAIPWAVSVAFLLCLLAPAVLDRDTAWARRRWWAVGLVLGLVAVLASQTRGALVIMVWLAWVLMRHLYLHRPSGAPRSLAALAAALVLVTSSAWWDADPLRLRAAGQDVVLALTQDQPDTSVGSRLEMWATAAKGIAQAPWLGHGIRAREAAMRELGAQHAPEIWAELRHFHNEYLNAWFDHGVLGLGAVLITLGGLMTAARAMRRQHPVASQQVWGLAVVHGFAGMTNVNTAHNLYTLALSLAVSAILLGAAHAPLTHHHIRTS